jgi:hypothetical protein
LRLSKVCSTFLTKWDKWNSRDNPQDTQDLQSTNALLPELNRIIQNDVTPEQFAENARNLENYSRVNAVALAREAYSQRQSEQAEEDV